MFGFGGLIIYEQVSAHAELSKVDGICQIGITRDAGYFVMAFDATINVALNGIFIWLLMPVLQSRAHREEHGGEQQGTTTNALERWSSTRSSVIGIFKYQSKGSGATTFRETVKDMLWRNVVGSTLVLLLTLANVAVFLTVSAAKLSHVCLLTCLSDGELLSVYDSS